MANHMCVSYIPSCADFPALPSKNKSTQQPSVVNRVHDVFHDSKEWSGEVNYNATRNIYVVTGVRNIPFTTFDAIYKREKENLSNWRVYHCCGTVEFSIRDS